MKTKNFSRMMLALFCATLMIMISYNSLASETQHPFGFEGVSAPGQFSDSFISTTRKTGSAIVSSSNVRTGTRSYLLAEDGSVISSVWWNITGGDFLTNFSFHYRTAVPLSPSRIYICLVNRTLANENGLTYSTSPLTGGEYKKGYLAVVYSYGAGNWYHLDEAGNQDVWATIGAWNTYHKVFISFDNNIGDMTLGLDNLVNGWDTIYSGVSCNGTAISEGYVADIIFIYADAPWSSTYFDDCVITLSDGYGGGSISGCSDFTGSTPTGRFAYGSTDVDSSHISTRYNVPVTTTITGVELQILQTQYDSDHELTHYTCDINGISLGNPVCIFAESYYYVVQWTCNYTLTASTVNFDFYHSQLMSGTQYWEVGCGVSSSDDVNGDGEVGFVFTDNSVVYHWEWILGIPFFMPTYGAGDTTFPRDLGMRFWSTGFTATETFDYDDLLGLASYSSSNSTGYIYDLSGGYDNIMGSYTLGNSGATYTLNLYVNGTRSYDYGFPIHCRYPGDGFGFSPNTIGQYRLQLNSTHAVANVTAWVIGARSGYSIRTNPVISNQYMSYSVIASYNNPQGYTGGVAMDNYVETLNTFLRCMYQRHPVTNNQSTTFSYQSNGTLPEYWGLYVYANNLYTKVDDCKHYIRLPSVYTNDIHTPLNNYAVSTEGVSSLGVTLIGTHMFPGGDVRIYANSIYVMNVGDSQYFTETFYPRAFGYYNVTMLLHQNGTFTHLANCNFTVSNSDSPGTEDPNQQYADLIPDEYKLFVAIGIILGFMFMPIAFIYSMNKTMQRFNVTVNVPAMVVVIMSVMTGIVGYTLTIMWGMLEWWTVFLLIFVLALVVLILYLKGGKTE